MNRRDRSTSDADRLARFVDDHPHLFVLTGAGLSTGSGIPDYRDENGDWKRSSPIMYRDFVDRETARRRYWARSIVGWPRFRRARPNAAHHSLARLERAGRIAHLVTQNVDGLHQVAGSERVTDLHGNLARVTCLDCGEVFDRGIVQEFLEAANPAWRERDGDIAPDGDADVDDDHLDGFAVPDCPRCAGMLKPAVVFFGENVPRERVRDSMASLARADAVLVAGTSLMVFSGYRFVREAAALNLPVAIVNVGTTRGDAAAAIRISDRCEAILPALAERFD